MSRPFFGQATIHTIQKPDTAEKRLVMRSPDILFKDYHPNFPTPTRSAARRLFRRAVREYYVMRRRYVIDPDSGDRVQSVLIGEVIKKQKTQRRKIKRSFTGKNSAGRPQRPEVKLLVARLFILWGRYASSPATLSRKSGFANPTPFEDFISGLLPQLGAPDIRRYVEAHWRERK